MVILKVHDHNGEKEFVFKEHIVDAIELAKEFAKDFNSYQIYIPTIIDSKGMYNLDDRIDNTVENFSKMVHNLKD
jgi:hypothetical protein